MTRAVLRLTPPRPPAARPVLDPAQAAAAAYATGAGHLLVVGAPGSGKTTTALALFEGRLAEHGGEDVLFLAPTRRRAAGVRDMVAARLDRTFGRVLVRTPASYAFSVLRARAGLVGEQPPVLVTGPEQDAILAELLAGHRAGLGAVPRWPAGIPDAARSLPAFRDELRDLLMRAAEAGLGPEGLAHLGRTHRRPEWVAAADVLAEYQDVLRLGQITPDRGERLDAASIVDEAARALLDWPAGARPRCPATVVLDDLQDATLATGRLVRVLADLGSQVIMFGDADAGVQGYRGGTPALVAAVTAGRAAALGLAAERIVLSTVWRQVPELRAVTRRVTAEIAATAGATHRSAPGRATPEGAGPTGVEVAVLRSRVQEAAFVARILREEHLRHGTGYSSMAVVVRGGGQAAALRRMLAHAGVPVASGAGETALRDVPAVRPLLAAMAVVLGAPLEPAIAAELLGSALTGGQRLDAVALRSLRRAVRTLAGPDDGRSAEDLVADILGDPDRCAELPSRVRGPATRIAAVLAAGRAAAARPGATAETVLWSLWSAAGVADTWRRTALAGGIAGERADRDLDHVLDLFGAAERFTDRNPAAPPAEFLRHLTDQSLPSDSLAPRADPPAAVAVLTAAAAAGGEWDVVVVAAVQEDEWPDLRVRDTVLGAGDLADLAADRGAASPGPGQARHEVLQDEFRAFAVAVSRARRRLIVTAVRDADLTPSPFLDLVDARSDVADHRPYVVVAEPFDLRGLLARLRAELPDGPEAAEAARVLAHLADRGVPGADPAGWPEAMEESTTAPLWHDEDVVELSPSAVDAALRCPLRWALERAGGRPASGAVRGLGTLVHEVAAALPHGTEDELRAELTRRWPELGLGDGWPARRLRAQADGMVRRLAAYLAGRPGRVDAEVPVEATVGRARIVGRIDRVEHGTDGSVRVVDLKTGQSRVSDVTRDAQLGAYQLAVDQGALGPEARPAGASLVYVGTGARAAERVQPALEGTWVDEVLGDVVNTVTAASFPAVVTDACRSCQVRSSCPAQPDGERVAP